MKPKAVLFQLWDKHFPVIRAFAEANPDSLILVQYPGIRGIPAFASFSGRIIPYEMFMPAAAKDGLAKEALDKAAFLDGLAGSAAWAGFCGNLELPPEATAKALFSDAGPRLLEQMVLIECLESALERLDIRAAVLNEENTLPPKTLVTWAKARSIPVLHINHSLGMSGWYTVHGKIEADALAVYGPIVADAPMETGYPGERVFISGNPDWLLYANAAGIKPGARRELLARLFSGADAPLVVFGTTFAANLTATEEGKDTIAPAAAFFRAVAALKRSGQPIHCVVKLRPNNDQAFEREYARVAAGAGLSRHEVVFMRTDLEKLLLAADAVVSVDSTLSADALLADTLAINLVTEEGWRRGPYYPAATGILECRTRELEGCLRTALGDAGLKARLAVLRERSRSAFQGARRDRDPTAYLADLISEMISEPGTERAPGKVGPAESGPSGSLPTAVSHPNADWTSAVPGSMSIVDIGDALETSIEPEAVLAAAALALAPSGELHCMVRNVARDRVIRGLLKGSWEPAADPRRIRFYTRTGLESLLAGSGFEIDACAPIKGSGPHDSDLEGLLAALGYSQAGSIGHLAIERYSIRARRSAGLGKVAGEKPAAVPGKPDRAARKAESPLNLVIDATQDLSLLESTVRECIRTRSGGDRVVCLVLPGQSAGAKARLGAEVTLLEIPKRGLSRSTLAMIRDLEGEFTAFLPPGVRFGAGWEARMLRHMRHMRHMGPGCAVGPLLNRIAGTQSVYHYLNASRIDPVDADAVSREIGMRFPGIALAADWLYDQPLVVGRDTLRSLSGLPDDRPDGHFLGLGKRLRQSGCRFLVAKDAYARLED